MANGTQSTAQPASSGGGKDFLAPVVALVVLVCFAVFVRYMLGMLTANETQWTRALYLFSGVEAIAFAAAGFFFGHQVQRQRAEKAEAKAEAAGAAAKTAAVQAAGTLQRATALAKAIEAKATAHPEKARQFESFGAAAPAASSAADFKELAALASSLFP